VDSVSPHPKKKNCLHSYCLLGYNALVRQKLTFQRNVVYNIAYLLNKQWIRSNEETGPSDLTFFLHVACLVYSSTLKMQTLRSSETSVNLCRTTLLHIRCENLKFNRIQLSLGFEVNLGDRPINTSHGHVSTLCSWPMCQHDRCGNLYSCLDYEISKYFLCDPDFIINLYSEPRWFIQYTE
jgi:hypothetical protein